jgi:hypothetical protein
MSTDAAEASYITRAAILNLLSDEEIARISTMEAGPPLVEGDEFIDLKHPTRGVRRTRSTTRVTIGDVLPRFAVEDATWSKICARLAVPNAKDADLEFLRMLPAFAFTP